MPAAERSASTSTPSGDRARRALAAAALVVAILVPAARAGAAAGDARTLVVRGRVLAADGAPVAGARVQARGSAIMTATTDERGRYSLAVPIGSAAGLLRGAFRLEVRAESGGRRLATASGASALGIEVALASGGSRVRVRTSATSATTAIATAFAQDGAATAWVDADFGGAAQALRAMVLEAVDEVALDGAGADTLPRIARPSPAAHAGSRAESRNGERGAQPAKRDSVNSAKAPRVVVAEAPAAAHAPPAPAPRPLAPSGAGEDSCSCRIRGTVEIDWERPLEKNLTVDVVLEGKGGAHAEVDMFMGSPREFRFGPLPCADYRLVMRPRGRLRYALENGDSVLVVPCRGLTQPRVVLVPARR